MTSQRGWPPELCVQSTYTEGQTLLSSDGESPDKPNSLLHEKMLVKRIFAQCGAFQENAQPEHRERARASARTHARTRQTAHMSDLLSAAAKRPQGTRLSVQVGTFQHTCQRS